MTAAIHDFTIEQGATLAKVFTWKDSTGTAINLTSYTARCMIRRRVDDSDILVSLTDPTGITLGGAAGTIQLNIIAAVTALLSGSGVYDLEVISSGGTVTRIAQGEIFFAPNVTR